MGCLSKDQNAAVNKLSGALRLLDRAGVGFENPLYSQLYRARGAAMSTIGVKVPRSVVSLLKLVGLSPGSVSLYFDADLGWITEAVEGPGARPVLRVIGDDLALKIIRQDLTHDEFQELKVPDEYIGE